MTSYDIIKQVLLLLCMKKVVGYYNDSFMIYKCCMSVYCFNLDVHIRVIKMLYGKQFAWTLQVPRKDWDSYCHFNLRVLRFPMDTWRV